MKCVSIHCYLCAFVSCAVTLTLTGCVAFDPVAQSEVQDLSERPLVAILPFGFDLEITKLSTVKTVDEPLSSEEEATHLAATLRDIEREARWLLLSRLATAYGFRFISHEQTDALAEELQLKPNMLPTVEQCAEFRRRLGVDLVIAGSILDYGKVRWQWLAALTLTDISVETIVLGLATSWHPALILANVGFEVLTNSAIYFGGGYLFGIALRPVRVEARAFETVQGYPIWQSMEKSVYAYGALDLLPEEVRDRKETQLSLNLAEIMESFGDDLIKQGYTVSRLRGAAVSFPRE